jgi:hypothetical protein
MQPETPAHSLDKFVLRLPEGMREKIGVAARANRRAMNAEIVNRLERSFVDAPAGALPEDVVKAILETRELVGRHSLGRTFAQDARAIGPSGGAKGIKEAYKADALLAFVKEFGVKDLLNAIGDAAPNLDIQVTEIDQEGAP